jgi:DNA-binding NarL/FixJ family response regulator
MRIVHPNLAYVKHILIVADSALIRRSLRILLSDCPDWVVCGEAENGSDGIEKAQQLHPDLIVMDLVMPVLNGIEATRLLKRLLPTTPIVMFTTFADPHIKKTALTAGVSCCYRQIRKCNSHRQHSTIVRIWITAPIRCLKWTEPANDP